MIIKKFTGKTEEEAVVAAKKELGDSVVIMNVKQVKKKGLFSFLSFGQVEVTVALEEERDVLARPKTDRSVGEKKTQDNSLTAAIAKSGVQQEKRTVSSANVSADNIEKKLDSLQTLLESQFKNAQKATQGDPEAARADSAEEKEAVKKETMQEECPEQDKLLRLLYNTMLANEVDEKYANQILEEIDKNKKPNIPIDYILASVYQKIILKFGKTEEITTSDKGPKVIVFLGPTGVGKTTTIAKIASKYVVEEKKRVALITADTYRIAAAEQLRTYANILEVAFRIVYTPQELQDAIMEYKAFDYIFVDTAGHSHQNEEQLQKMHEMMSVIDELAQWDAFLVLSATTKYKDLLRIADSYKDVTKYQLIFTKLDETDSLGNLLNVKLYTGAPIAYVTYGQNVPDDIEQFNPQKTVKQLLGGKSTT